MSCGRDSRNASRGAADGRLALLADEGFRLFFPLAALYAALWPLLWIFAFSFDLPLATTVTPSLWHAHEMLVGAFGAALIGFLTTAAPEWTDVEPLRGRALWLIAVIWGVGRLIGLFGWDGLGAIGAVADLTWIAVLLVYLCRISWRKKTDVLLAFMFWLSVLLASVAWTRMSFLLGNPDASTQGVYLVGFTFLGFLGLALARITIPVTNLILDPTETSSPYRPHPGRLHLAPGLVLLVMIAETAGLSPAVSGFILVSAGAAFLDRVSEAFIGREAFRAEILMLAGSSMLAGAGLILTGAARLSAPWSEVTGLHLCLMGGLGLGVLTVFSIAGLLHTNRPLGLSPLAKLSAILLTAAVAVRVLPEIVPAMAGLVPHYAVASLLWASAFLVWIVAYAPALTDRGAVDIGK